MLSRIRYTVSVGMRNRKKLRNFLLDPNLQLRTITDLRLADLERLGIQILVLDFDGVLAPHAEPCLDPQVYRWLQDFSQSFPVNKIYILSNKPTIQRQEYFQQHFPGIKFIVAKRKKPYPDGLLQIIQETAFKPEQLLLVDDRLGTGIIAAIISGTRAYWVNQPYADFKKRPVRESFFAGLRWLEQKLLAININKH